MRKAVIVALSLSLSLSLLAACGSPPPSAPPTASPPTASPAVTSPASSSPPPRLIPGSAADREVCRRFLGQVPGSAGANAFMAWATFGAGQATANRSSGKLVTATVTWFDDSYQSWGDPWKATPDWDAVAADCASIGVTG